MQAWDCLFKARLCRTESLIQAVWVTNYLCHLLQKIKDKNNSKLTQKWLVLDQIDRLTSQQSVFFTVLCIYFFKIKVLLGFCNVCSMNDGLSWKLCSSIGLTIREVYSEMIEMMCILLTKVLKSICWNERWKMLVFFALIYAAACKLHLLIKLM